MRDDGRTPSQLRPCTIVPGFIGQATGSTLVTTGRTRVICTVNVEERAPSWLTKGGWVTAQYAMLPGATAPRGSRDPGARGKEIQRLVGRALRASVDLERLVGPTGPLSLVCDCDVIEADGGTRTASITGAWVALAIAIRKLVASGRLPADPTIAPVAATSVGLCGDPPQALLDLAYTEDSTAIVDLNVVALADRGLVEVQGTGEHGVFSRKQLDTLLDLAETGTSELFAIQRAALEAAR
jgi:ribonuclease PH